MQIANHFEPQCTYGQGHSNATKFTALSYQERLKQYEREKALLRDAGLTHKEYEQRTHALADELDV